MRVAIDNLIPESKLVANFFCFLLGWIRNQVAIDSVNARGSIVAARLRNISARVNQVACHEAHEGTARAIAVVSTMSRADYRQWEPIFREWGAAREDFEELVDDLCFPADVVVSDVSLDGVVGNLFGEESD